VDLDKLKILLQVAEAKSLSKAAALHGTLQSVLSRQVSALERECGGRLFHRTGRGVTPTELAERILPRVRALVLEGEQLANDLRGAAAAPVGEVRFGTLSSFSHPLVTRLFVSAREQFPGIRLRVYEGSGGQLEEWVATGRIDIALVAVLGRGVAANAQPLGRIALHLVGPAGDSLTAGPTVKFARLDGLPLVLPGPPAALRPLLDQVARRKRISINVAMETDSLAIQKDIAAEGGAYTVAGAHAVRREVQEGRLQHAQIVNPVVERPIALITTRHHPLTFAAREIARLVKRTVDAAPLAVGDDVRASSR